MATKKQKREAAEAKRAAFEEERRLSGLRAQEADHRRTEAIRERTQTVVDEINEKHKEVLKENFIELSRDYGMRVLKLETEGDFAQRTLVREDWLMFLHSLPEHDRRVAVNAYYEKYCKNFVGEDLRRVRMVGSRMDLGLMEAISKSTQFPKGEKDRIKKFFGVLAKGGFADEVFNLDPPKIRLDEDAALPDMSIPESNVPVRRGFAGPIIGEAKVKKDDDGEITLEGFIVEDNEFVKGLFGYPGSFSMGE